MNLVEQIALGLQAFRFTAREWTRGALWVPFLAWLAAHGLLLVGLLFWAHPALSWLMAPLIAQVGGAMALHYPDFFRLLPALARHAATALGVLVTPLALGVATRAFAWRWRGQARGLGDAWREVRPRAWTLLVVSLPPVLAITLAEFAAAHVLAPRLSSLMRPAIPGAIEVFAWLVGIAWAYAVALVVLDRHGVVETIRALPYTWEQGALPAAVVLALAALVQWPGAWLVQHAGVVAERGLPDLVGGIVAIRFAFACLAGFLTTGALTLVWTSALSATRGSE